MCDDHGHGHAHGVEEIVVDEIVSDRAAEAVGPYPHAKRFGNLLFVSGIGPRRRGAAGIPGTTVDASSRVIDHDIEVQARACLENIRMILEDAGSGLENVIDVTAFLTHLDRDFAAFNRVYAEHFPERRPSRTTVEVSKLPTPIAIELKVIAWVD